jgi:tyrosine aminotransferase
MRPKRIWNVTASAMSENTFNPIRNILETMTLCPNPDMSVIDLSIGDPTKFKDLRPHEETIGALVSSATSGAYNGYAPSSGHVKSRKAVAKHVSCEGAELSENDVILCSGCSCALDLSISAMANPGENILVPRPGFPLYATLANGLGIKTREYDLLPEREWEADLEHMESLIDEDTRAIVVNNPSNPCGSVFSRAHLLAILDVAERNCVPIIADEIYDHFVFPGREYISIASLTTEVPVLSCGGLTKRFLIPGWRLGWITIHDRNQVLGQKMRVGLQNLSQRIIGANTIVQGALADILSRTPKDFFRETIDVVRRNAELAFARLSTVPGLKPVMPAGAMYMMVGVETKRFRGFETDLKVVEALYSEKSLFFLPGKCFGVADYFRMVLTASREDMGEACDRLESFCCQYIEKEEESSSRSESSSPCVMTTSDEDDARTTSPNSMTSSTNSEI